MELLAGVDVASIARSLLGWRLRSEIGEAPTEVRITEVEAYGGADDPASHAHRGPTRRNVTMFGPPGRLYVYRSYGVHWCLNVVTGPEGVASAVLLRGAVPLVGEEIMRRRRHRADHLLDGPGKLAQALGVTGREDGGDLFAGPVRLIPGRLAEGWRVQVTPRVGITRARERRWRFLARPRLRD